MTETKYNGYFATEDGRIIGTRSGKQIELTGGISNAGYRRITIMLDDGSQKTVSIHRIIAESFIDNPECKEQVNHIDGDKLNNSVSNLEWATRSENKLHSMSILGEKLGFHSKDGKTNSANAMKKSKAVVKDIDEASEIAEFIAINKLSYREAERVIGISRPTLTKICKNETIAYQIV